MKYKLYFSLANKYENMEFWIPLMEYFLKRADTIEIHCWNEEKEVIAEIETFLLGSFERKLDKNITIYKGPNIPDVSNYILRKALNNEGKIKWFSIFLSKEFENVFHSEHWGKEYFAPAVNEKDIEFIKEVMPQDTNYYQYDEI